MKKQYLFCLVLLLSAPYIEYTCAMQGWYNAPVQYAAHSEQCTLCHQNMPYGSIHNPRVRLACGHIFHNACITHWNYGRWYVNSHCPTCHRSIQFVPDYPEQILQPVQPVQPAPVAQVINQAQPARAPQQAQPAAQAEQEQCAICYEENMTYDNIQDPRVRLRCGHKFHQRCLESWRNASYNPTCPMCRGPFITIPDYPDPVTQSVQQVQAVNQAQPVLSQAQPEQRAEQRRVLTPAERAIVNQIADNLESYPNFVQCLHDAGLLEQFLGQAQEQEMPAARQEQQRLTQVEHDLVAQLAQELAPLERDDIDAVLFEAYTNPNILAQSDVLRRVLNDRQGQLIDDLLLMYTQRMSEQ